MKNTPDLASVAALIADPSRAAMLSALLGGYALPASELARHAQITAQTASTHLAKMVSGDLLSVKQTGRHRYYSLRSKEVAQVLETLALIAPAQRIHSLKHSLQMQAICHARTCYDHLAGTLGVRLTEAMIEREMIAFGGEAFEVTASGIEWFTAVGIDCAVLHNKRRAFASMCVDWSERKPHLAGSLGAAFANYLLVQKWITRVNDSRAVKVTSVGWKMFQEEFGISELG